MRDRVDVCGWVSRVGVCVDVCGCVWMHVNVCVRVSVRVYLRACVRTHTHTHTQTIPPTNLQRGMKTAVLNDDNVVATSELELSRYGNRRRGGRGGRGGRDPSLENLTGRLLLSHVEGVF